MSDGPQSISSRPHPCGCCTYPCIHTTTFKPILTERQKQEAAQTGHGEMDPNAKPTNPKDIAGMKKAALSCVPLPVLIEIGLGMMEGMFKYGRHNYRAMGVRASAYFDATIRHLFAWWEGEDMDPDTDNMVHHISKAITSLTVLRDAMLRGKMQDDRPPSTPNLYLEANKQAEILVAKYADRKPHHYTIKDNL